MGHREHMTTQHLNWSCALTTTSENRKRTFKYNNICRTYRNVGVLVNNQTLLLDEQLSLLLLQTKSNADLSPLSQALKGTVPHCFIAT